MSVTQNDSPPARLADYRTAGMPLSTVQLKLGRLDLVAHWRRCGMTADYLASFLAYNFDQRDTVQLVLSTVFNELIENAVKFSVPGTEALTLGIEFNGDDVVIETRHACRPAQVEHLCAFVDRLRNGDVEEMFVRQIERTAAEDPGASGLGFIMITKDYGARLEVEVQERSPDATWIAVRAILSVEEVESR